MDHLDQRLTADMIRMPRMTHEDIADPERVTRDASPRVAIIGGGYAGFAAAVTLCDKGIPVTLFEGSKNLGGRARRVAWRGLNLDNGFHILLGCYRDTLRLINQVGVAGGSGNADLYRTRLQLVIKDRFRLNAAPLPAPLHLAVGLLVAQGLALHEKIGAIKLLQAIRRSGFSLPQDISVACLLAQHRQGPRISHYLWNPLCLAALNTAPEKASARIFLRVLRDSLTGAKVNSDILIPKMDLSALFPDPAAAYIRRHGSRVLTSTVIASIEEVSGGFSLKGSENHHGPYSHVICAVQPYRLPSLLASFPTLGPICRMVEQFEYQPIYSIYLQYPEDISLPLPMLGLAGSHAQWVFDRGALCGQKGLLGAVISGEGSHEKFSQEELAMKVHNELEQALGPLPPPIWHQVIAEKRATFAAFVDIQRPPVITPVCNLFLAGDYTDSEYPATIEAAVRSGIQCASQIIRNA